MKRMLMIFEFNSNVDKMLESALFLRTSYGLELVPIYIKDIKRTGIISPVSQGLAVNYNDIYITQQDEFEKSRIDMLKSKLKEYQFKEELNVEFGFLWDTVKEYLKEADILVFEKEQITTDRTFSILKNVYKPIIMLGENSLNSLNRIMISSDDGVKVNRSVYEFLNLFNQIKKFDIYSISVKESENRLLNYLKNKDIDANYFEFDGDGAEAKYFEKTKEYDMVIMGNLSRSYLFEKLTRRKGINIMEQVKATVFIG